MVRQIRNRLKAKSEGVWADGEHYGYGLPALWPSCLGVACTRGLARSIEAMKVEGVSWTLAR